MKRFQSTILSVSLLAASAAAQTQLVRGKVEDVRGTSRFVLDCTNIELISTTLNLNNFVGQQADLQIVNVGTATQPILQVQSALVTQKRFDMGNLRFGRNERWEVNGVPGSLTAVFVQATSATTYLPYGAAGTWLLGTQSAFVTSGTITNFGQFQFSLMMPTIPALVGVSFSGQAIVAPPSGGLLITNADCKEVRAD